MNQYPLDDEGIQKIFHHLIEHNSAQVEIVEKLTGFLREAMSEMGMNDTEWYEEAEILLQTMHQRKMDFDNFRFDQKNGHKADQISPYPDSLPTEQMLGPSHENALNSLEESFGEVMTEEELARHFKEPLPKKPKKSRGFSDMTIEEINEWEASQNNSNDIYKVAARMKNAARMAVQGNLTAQGEMVVNTFTHMVKSFYDFANTIPDKEIKIKLTELTRKQEELPANLISALWAGVKAVKEKDEEV